MVNEKKLIFFLKVLENNHQPSNDKIYSFSS